MSLQEYKELFTITIIPHNTIDTNNISFHGVRSIGQSRTLKKLIQGFQQGFHCVILDLKDLTSAELFKEYRLTIVSRIIVWVS